jgi:large subunit ribosomal protein L29
MSTNFTSLSIDELKVKYQEIKKSYQNMKFSHAVTPLENPHILRKTRRDIARLMFELSNRS